LTFTLRRLLAITTAGLLMIGVLAGCGGTDDAVDKAVDAASNGKVRVDKDGNKITVDDGDSSISIGDTKLPDDFPKGDVPLPDGGTLKAVVSGKKDGDQYFSLTYAIDGADLKSAAKDYRSQLEHAGYRIESSSSIGGNAASFSAFTAIGSDWDVIAYSGGSSAAEGALSLQVTTHDPSKDDSSSSSSTGSSTESSTG
jgi:hypothetical protein